MSGQVPGRPDASASSEMASPELQSLCRAMPAILKSKFPGISYADAEDITATAVLRMVQRYQDRVLINDPVAYFYRVANNSAVEWFRNRARQKEDSLPNSLMASLPMSDDRAAAAFDGVSTAADVRKMLRCISENSDATLFRIVTYMLDQIYRTGKVPSNRQVGEACGFSHTGVAKALVRLRSYF